MPSTTGDIIWTRSDPTTWTLSNKPPSADDTYDTIPNLGEDTQAEEAKPLPGGMGEADYNIFAHAIREHEAAQKRFQRRQLRDFHKSLKDPSTDVPSAVQGLFDSGAVYMKDGDVYTSTTQPSGKKDALLDAVHQWRQQSGMEEDTYYGGGQEQQQQPMSQEMMQALGKQMGLMSQMYKQGGQ